MNPFFLFVRIHDKPAINLLEEIRIKLKGKPSKSPIHITVRGPLKNRPTANKLESLWSILEGEGLLLHGIGRFEFSDREIVYIKSHSHAIRKIWWKRDYPIIRFGFNPHISLYEGPPIAARAVEEKLRSLRIELFCRELSLSLYSHTGDDLFPSTSTTEIHRSDPISGQVLVDPYRWNRKAMSDFDDFCADLRLLEASAS